VSFKPNSNPTNRLVRWGLQSHIYCVLILSLFDVILLTCMDVDASPEWIYKPMHTWNYWCRSKSETDETVSRETKREERTCINKAVMEMKTEQGCSHATLFGNSTFDCRFDGGESSGAWSCIEIWRKLRRGYGKYTKQNREEKHVVKWIQSHYCSSK